MSQKTLNITKRTLLKACSGTLLTAAMICGSISSADAQVLVKNNGAIFAIKPGATVIVKTGSVENDGLVDNGGTLIVEGDFINQDTANGGATTGKYEVQQDWVNNGRFQADQSEVELYGANQLITGANSTTFFDLTLTGTGIKTQTLDATVTDTLALNDRELATDIFKMFVTNTATGAISRSTGYVSSLGAGRLSRDFANAGLYLFPTGSSVGTTRYRPLEVTPSTANAQTLEVRMANVDATTEGFNVATKEADLCEVNDLYYHLIGHSAGATDNVALTAYFDLAADGAWKTVAHWQNTPQWENIGPATPGAAGGLNSVTIPAWNVFTPEPFALANDNPSIDTALTSVTDASCFGYNDGAIDITLTSGTDLTYTYSPTGGAGPDASGLIAGTYNLVITDTVTGCNRSAVPYTFTVDQPLEIGIDSVVTAANCNGDANGAITLTITNAANGVGSVIWSGTTQTGPTINNLTAGTYGVTVTDNNGCFKTDTIDVTEPNALVADATTITPANCNGDANGEIDLDITGGTGGYTIIWSTADTTEDLNGLNAGTYDVVVTDGNGCTDSLIGLTITEPDVLTLTASADTTIVAEESANIEVLSTSGGTGSLTYEWTPGATLTDAFAASTVAMPIESTTYIVTGTDDNGCTAVDTVLVRVDFNLVAIPDGFTPNGDGFNDVFTIHHSTAIDLVELKIFNRWGELVYEANDWDGVYKDKKQPMDTYIYQAVFQLPDGSSANYSGDFLLIR